MVSMVSREVLLRQGERWRPHEVVGQGQYTFGLAAKDAVLAEKLGPFLAEAQEALGALEQAGSDRKVAITQALEATRRQNEVMLAGTRWALSFTASVRMAAWHGHPVPREAAGMRRGTRTSPLSLATEMERLAK